MGPFEVVENIASGGMGDVWSGVHVAQDVPVAIKVLKQHRADDRYSHAVFRREVRAVAQLNHPGIIALFDVGDVTEDAAKASGGVFELGNPYLVMEYLERGSLDSLEYPLPWPVLRKTLIAVLDGLAHAHARGITHRDLKPANILIAEEVSGSPIRLTDFGLAFPYGGRPAAEEEGMAAGTPSYMAPEQFFSEWRDFRPWTDLYALGCVAYELASGRVPFMGDLLSVGMAHIETPPPPLACPNDYPAGFDSWVMTLLEKDPLRRYRRCSEAAAALASLTGPAVDSEERPSQTVKEAGQSATKSAVSQASESDWRAPATPQRPFKLIGAGLKLFGLRTVPMVNRDMERDLMWQTLRRVSERDSAELVLVEGAAGTGKSRLTEWFCQRAHEMGLADYLKAEHDEIRGSESGLSHMLASAWSCVGIAADELLNRITRILASAGVESQALQRAVVEFLAPAALGDSYSFGMSSEVRSPQARFSALYEVLHQMYSERPLVLWLDDVHWSADALHFARYVLDRSQTESAKMLLVLTARDDLLIESPEASNVLHELAQRQAVQSIQLGPLPDADNRRLVNSLLYFAGDLAERVAQRSGGNPLYATQLVGDWVDRGILRPGRGGFVLSGTAHPEIPDDIHAVWVQRLERVLDLGIGTSRSAATVAQRIQTQVELELAAALGGRVNMAEWQSLCSLTGAPDPNHVLEPLLASRLARASDDGWSFSHSMLRDTIERIARESGRWASHNRLCADELERRHPIPNWGDSERIGRHRFEATQFDEAVGPLLRGTKERMRVEEYSAALALLTLYADALDQIGAPIEDPRQLNGWLLRADIKCTRGELAGAEEIANRVIALAGSADTQRFTGSALLVLARVHQQQGRLRSALEEFLEAERILRVTGPKHELAACLSEQAHGMLDLSLLSESWEAFNEAQQIYEEIHQLVPWAENQLGLARVALHQGDPQHCTTLCRRVLAFAKRESLSRVESAAWLVLSEVEAAGGRLNDAAVSLDKSIDLLEQTGLVSQTYYPRLLKTLLLLQSGSADRAGLEFDVLRNRPEVEVPRVSLLLMSCVGLAIAMDGSAEEFQSSLDRTKDLLAETEVVTPYVASSLQLAVGLAEKIGLPDRAARVRELATFS
jgi:tetratricopeptide (TPR) repeat protein/tRNA A-37 threonylcarbamoyl transferase component Bud32